MLPKPLEDLIECFKMLPGVGSKSAERYALLMMDKSEEEVKAFAAALINSKKLIKRCSICGNYSLDDTCDICKNTSRNKKIICVVQSSKDIIAMEKVQEYTGVYHVLNGLIATTKGVLPEDLNIDSLMSRADDAEEVILALNPTLEGETTSLYLSRLLEKKGVLVTRIANGIPMGGHLDYADELTLLKALQGRKEIK